jgi:hypothetical protein
MNKSILSKIKLWLLSPVTIYTAAKMTGRDQKEMVETAKRNKSIFEAAGIRVLDPILEEHVKAEKGPLVDKPIHVLQGYWDRDKQMIREAHIVVDTTPEAKSEGSAHEIGYARYFLWKPVIRLYGQEAKPLSAIVFFEDDLIVHSTEEAAIQIQKYWGTWFKRFMWRLSLYNRCWLKAWWYKLGEWK